MLHRSLNRVEIDKGLKPEEVKKAENEKKEIKKESAESKKKGRRAIRRRKFLESK